MFGLGVPDTGIHNPPASVSYIRRSLLMEILYLGIAALVEGVSIGTR